MLCGGSLKAPGWTGFWLELVSAEGMAPFPATEQRAGGPRHPPVFLVSGVYFGGVLHHFVRAAANPRNIQQTDVQTRIPKPIAKYSFVC